MNGWIGVDLDGTLAEYHGWQGTDHIGAPIQSMVERVKQWLAEGRDVRIFTARAWPSGTSSAFDPTPNNRADEAYKAMEVIRAWCFEHIGRTLPITCTKDYGMVELWDDRAVQVIPNTGIRADGAEG